MPNFPTTGMKASQLIQRLKNLMEKHGDRPVSHGGGDYPEGVEGVTWIASNKGDGYVPGNSFKIW